LSRDNGGYRGSATAVARLAINLSLLEESNSKSIEALKCINIKSCFIYVSYHIYSG